MLLIDLGVHKERRYLRTPPRPSRVRHRVSGHARLRLRRGGAFALPSTRRRSTKIALETLVILSSPEGSEKSSCFSQRTSAKSFPGFDSSLHRSNDRFRALRISSHPSMRARQRPALPWGSFPLRRFETRAATCAGFSSPDCAAPSGFLDLLTRYSALVRSALFRADSVHGVHVLRGFPLPVAATAFSSP